MMCRQLNQNRQANHARLETTARYCPNQVVKMKVVKKDREMIETINENQRRSENHVNVKEKRKVNLERRKRKSQQRKKCLANKVKRLFRKDLFHLLMKVMTKG